MRASCAAIFLLLCGCSGPQTQETAAEPAERPTETEPHEHAESQAQAREHHKHESMQHRFEDAERWSKVFDAPERDAWQKPAHVIELMQIEPGLTVADIGAGTGYFLLHLSRAVGPEGEVLARDIEPNLVKHMNERARESGLDNVVAQATAPDDPGLPAGGVHRILIVNTWHHIGAREEYAAKLATALAPGGAVYVVDFTLETERGPSRDHKLAPDIVISELSSAGLDVTTLEEELPDQYVIRAARR